MKGGKITREYTAEEFNGLSEQARTEIGLRTFAWNNYNRRKHRNAQGRNWS